MTMAVVVANTVAAATVGAVGTANISYLGWRRLGAERRSGGGRSGRREEGTGGGLVTDTHKEGGVDSTRHNTHTVECSYLGRERGRRYRRGIVRGGGK